MIVPTRDTRLLTLRCLGALAASTVSPLETLVVDDGSADRTAEAIAEAYPAVRVLHRRSPGGFTAAINDAWPLVRGDLVLLLNSDTEIEPEAVACLLRAFATDATLGIAGATLRHVDGRAQWSAGGEPGPLWLFALGSGAAALLGRLPGWRRLRPESQGARGVAWVPATAMTVRRSVAERLGGFDAAFVMYAQDLDFCTRARAAGWRVARLADVVVMHHGGSTIGARPGAVGARLDPEALAADLVRFLRKSLPAAEARRRQRALEMGTALRVLARAAATWLRRGSAREAWERDTRRYRAALERVRS